MLSLLVGLCYQPDARSADCGLAKEVAQPEGHLLYEVYVQLIVRVEGSVL